jgi:hypothetical protein
VVVDDGPTPTTVDNTVRPAHVRTSTVQEMVGCAAAAGGGLPPPDALAPGARRAGMPSPGDAGAPPQAVPDSADLRGSTLTLRVTAPLDPSTVTRAAFTVTTLRASGWAEIRVDRAELDEAGTTVTLRLAAAPRTRPVRVVAHGGGPMPLMGADGRPLAGAVGGRPPVSGGADAALMVGPPEGPPTDDDPTE